MTLEPLPPYGEHMTLKEFIVYCESGALMDSDGFAEYATPTELSNKLVNPSDIISGVVDHSFTHTVWFNK